MIGWTDTYKKQQVDTANSINKYKLQRNSPSSSNKIVKHVFGLSSTNGGGSLKLYLDGF